MLNSRRPGISYPNSSPVGDDETNASRAQIVGANHSQYKFTCVIRLATSLHRYPCSRPFCVWGARGSQNPRPLDFVDKLPGLSPATQQPQFPSSQIRLRRGTTTGSNNLDRRCTQQTD